jgi:bacteriorhodopsin
MTPEKFSEKGRNYALFGASIIAFSIGAMFSIDLVKYGYYLLIGATFAIVHYVSIALFKNKVNRLTKSVGVMGVLALVLFFGIQTPQIPLKQYLWIVGTALFIPAIKDFIIKPNT